ncbi:hypothetical protein DUNSADRAFT_4831 [Dunaliella salina]|uniref:Encoded protein n=1 Tax=Dunaliella salina TaxID=3046 RepID=A0ABQ7GR79_DUNSA|nr:hypothetical protein DUNSADRAFT_4831 [Dunaliella salina]|eukprot:KAF5837108.1 hypothetical protein DUNSADRAFT_4831 [Dunaliella salina]
MCCSGLLNPDALGTTQGSSTAPQSTHARAPTGPRISDSQHNTDASSAPARASSGNVLPISSCTSSTSTSISNCPHVLLSRALAILDAPLHAGENTACLVLPPHTSGCGNPHPIRGLLSAPSLFVTPPGRFLLHLSTPSTPRDSGPHARLDLERAVQQLAECEGLLGPGHGAPEEQGSSEKAAEVQGSGLTSGPSKPRAVQVHYYIQQVTMPAGLGVNSTNPVGAPASGSDAVAAAAAAAAAVAPATPACKPPLPRGVVCCPGPNPSMAGCTAAVEAAQHMLAQHFPGVPWLGERSGGSPEDGEEADREGGAGIQEPDEEVEAIMALQASLDQLRAHEEKC